MQIEKLKFDDVRYNPEFGAFEANVQVDEKGKRFFYPVSIRAPLNADFSVIARGLARKAAKAHRTPTGGLRLIRAEGPATVSRPAPHLRKTPLMHRMLNALAA